MTTPLLPRSRSTFVQTWHGTPLKLLGHDEQFLTYPGARAHLDRLRRDVERWDLLLSPSPVCTSLLRTAFRYDGPVLETGLPRNDLLVGNAARLGRIRARDALDVGDDHVVLYVPTWRDNGQSVWQHPEVRSLIYGIPEGVRLLVRSHPNEAPPEVGKQVIDVSAWPEVADLYVAADSLLADYSSAIYDFAVTRKPIVLLAPDLTDYVAMRGMYFDYEAWAPGPIVTTAADAYEALLAGVKDAKRYARFVQTFCPFDDGGASGRLLDFLLG